jgi:hypothetical protein
MIGRDQNCKICSKKLNLRENEDSALLVCVNKVCKNYWVNDGSEIIMMLK